MQSDACGGICHQAAAAFWTDTTDTKYPRYSLEQERAPGVLFIFRKFQQTKDSSVGLFIPSAGLDDLPIGGAPESFDAVEALDDGLAFFQRHAEQAGGQAVSDAGIGGQHTHAVKVSGGPEGGGVDEVVVAHTIDKIVALIVAAGDEGEVTHFDSGHRGGAASVDVRGVPRVFHTADPLGAVGLGADGPQIAAHADEGAGQAAGLGGLSDHLHGVAFAHAAHIQRHLRVGQVDRSGVVVDDEVMDVAVLGGSIQLVLRGQLVVAVVGVGEGSFAVIVPDVEHTAHGDVQLAVGGVVHGLGQLQHPQDLVVRGHGGKAGVVVDGLDVGDAVVVVVDVVELVIFQQVGVECVHLSGELLLAVAVGNDLGHGVKGVIEHGGVALRAVGGAGSAGRSGTAAAGQQAQAERGRQENRQDAFHAWAVSFAAVKAVCSSCRWASRSPKTQFLLEGVTRALSGIFT